MPIKKKTRNTKPAAEPINVAEPANRGAAAVPRSPAVGKCSVCGSDVAPFSSEELCWVCRRLKISAWREAADNQAAMQE